MGEFDVVAEIKPYVDKHSDMRQVRILIKTGGKKQLLSGFVAIHHPGGADTILPIYLSNQNIFIFEQDLFNNEHVSKAAGSKLRLTLCLNQSVRPDGELAGVFLDDIQRANDKIKAVIHKDETRRPSSVDFNDSVFSSDSDLSSNTPEPEPAKIIGNPRWEQVPPTCSTF